MFAVRYTTAPGRPASAYHSHGAITPSDRFSATDSMVAPATSDGVRDEVSRLTRCRLSNARASSTASRASASCTSVARSSKVRSAHVESSSATSIATPASGCSARARLSSATAPAAATSGSMVATPRPYRPRATSPPGAHARSNAAARPMRPTGCTAVGGSPSAASAVTPSANVRARITRRTSATASRVRRRSPARSAPPPARPRCWRQRCRR